MISVGTLQQYRNTSRDWLKKFYDLRPNDEEVGHLLKDLESDMARVELYLIEEEMANYVKFLDEGNGALPRIELLEMPENVSHTYDEETDAHSFVLPLWPFTQKKAGGMRPPFHKGREFIRINDFWRALLWNLVPPEQLIRDRQGVKPGKETAGLHFRFITTREIDMDHYDVGPLVNRLIGAGIILNDHPARMKLSMDYETVSNRSDEKTILTIKYGF